MEFVYGPLRGCVTLRGYVAGLHTNGVFVKYLQNNTLLKGTKKLTSYKYLTNCILTKTPLVCVRSSSYK